MKKSIGYFIIVVLLLHFISLETAYTQPSKRMKTGFYLGANGGNLYPEYFWMYNELNLRTDVEWGFSGEYQAPFVYSSERIYGGFFEPVSFYFPSISNMFTKWNESTK